MIELQWHGIPVRCKTARIRDELLLGKLHPKLVAVLILVTAYVYLRYGLPAEFTDIWRTEEEQNALYPNGPYKMSVHQVWRGADLVVRIINEKDRQLAYEVIRDLVNRVCPYDPDGKYETCKYHSVGAGWHLHFQVRWDS